MLFRSNKHSFWIIEISSYFASILSNKIYSNSNQIPEFSLEDFSIESDLDFENNRVSNVRLSRPPSKSTKNTINFCFKDKEFVLKCKDSDDSAELNDCQKFTFENDLIDYEEEVSQWSEKKQILKVYWLVLRGQDLYYYSDKTKSYLIKMRNISGCFIHEENLEKAEFSVTTETSYKFKIKFRNLSRQYLTSSSNIAKEWIYFLQQSINYRNFYDFYSYFLSCFNIFSKFNCTIISCA